VPRPKCLKNYSFKGKSGRRRHGGDFPITHPIKKRYEHLNSEGIKKNEKATSAPSGSQASPAKNLGRGGELNSLLTKNRMSKSDAIF